MWFLDQEIPKHGILSGTHRLLHLNITRTLSVTNLLALLLKQGRDIMNRSHRLRDLGNQRRLSFHDQGGVRQHLLSNLHRGTLSTEVTLALDRWGRAEYATDVVEQSISPYIR